MAKKLTKRKANLIKITANIRIRNRRSPHNNIISLLRQSWEKQIMNYTNRMKMNSKKLLRSKIQSSVRRRRFLEISI